MHVDYIQFDLLGLITVAFTNVKFQMDSTEGGDQWQVTTMFHRKCFWIRPMRRQCVDFGG